MVAAALRASGLRVGLYTSPHLVTVRERMVVDGRPISEPAFAAWTNRLRPVIEETGASFFEVTTVIALADMAARGVEIGVVEVGLGGRLDSTNVLDPLVSAVTNVSHDHGEYLGDTLEAIAVEKAAIAKRGKPFVIGEEDEVIAGVLEDRAKQMGAAVTRLPTGSMYDGRVGMSGTHQRRNAAIAALVLRSLPATVRPDDAAVRTGLATAWLPGRLDRRGSWLFDVAHNPAGMQALASYVELAGLERPIHALLGVMADKDGAQMLRILEGCSDRIWVTEPPGVQPGRSGAPEGWLPSSHPAEVEPDFERALSAATELARTTVVTGSFYTVGAALARLPGFQPVG